VGAVAIERTLPAVNFDGDRAFSTVAIIGRAPSTSISWTNFPLNALRVKRHLPFSRLTFEHPVAAGAPKRAARRREVHLLGCA
jgi:hypothetical protein